MRVRSWLLAGTPLLLAIVTGADLALSQGAPMTRIGESFAAESARAMDRMMGAMSVPSTGDVDRDFVATMVPHHQGAIDMALAELRFGKDETLRRMAQEIIVEQKQEIAAMLLAAKTLPGTASTAPMRTDVCRSTSVVQPTHARAVQEGH